MIHKLQIGKYFRWDIYYYNAAIKNGLHPTTYYEIELIRLYAYL